MKKSIKPVMGKAGAKMIFGPAVKKGSRSNVNHGKKIPFNVAQFHAKKGNVTN